MMIIGTPGAALTRRVRAACADATRAAQVRASARTISEDALGSLYDPLVSHGIATVDGGGVCKSYRYPAEGTTAVLAWWTDPRGQRHVKIEVRRAPCGGASGQRERRALSAREAWGWVYPERDSRLRAALERRALRAARVALGYARTGADGPQSQAECRRERVRRVLDAIGPQGADDRASLLHATVTAVAADGSAALLSSTTWRRRRESPVVQVVVRDATTGQRHAITVPPRFRPGTATWERLGTDAARIHAAVAWTFSLRPAEYAPVAEA